MKPRILFTAIVTLMTFQAASIADSRLTADMKTLQACLGVGLLAREAGVLRDKGVQADNVHATLTQKLAGNDASRQEAARKAAAFPTTLAFRNKELNPQTLHSLGTKMCVFGTKVPLSEKTISVMSQYALACQEQYTDANLVNGCMDNLDSLLDK
jgi:hypothetical protein